MNNGSIGEDLTKAINPAKLFLNIYYDKTGG